jgi:hypothetical protein
VGSEYNIEFTICNFSAWLRRIEVLISLFPLYVPMEDNLVLLVSVMEGPSK